MIAAAVSFVIFALLLKLSGFSVEKIITIQNSIFTIMGNPAFAGELVSSFLYMLLSLIFLSLGLAFLSTQGYFNDDKKIGLISSIAGAIAILILLNFTLPGVFLAVALIVASIYVIPLSNTYGKELKRWVFFRVGSNGISKALMIMDVLIVVGILLAVYSSLPFYQESFRESFTDAILAMAPAGIPTAAVEQQVVTAVESSPMLAFYLRWLPVLIAVTAWVALEFLRAFILSNIGGVFTAIMIRVKKKQLA